MAKDLYNRAEYARIHACNNDITWNNIATMLLCSNTFYYNFLFCFASFVILNALSIPNFFFPNISYQLKTKNMCLYASWWGTNRITCLWCNFNFKTYYLNRTNILKTIHWCLILNDYKNNMSFGCLIIGTYFICNLYNIIIKRTSKFVHLKWKIHLGYICMYLFSYLTSIRFCYIYFIYPIFYCTLLRRMCHACFV